MWHDVILGGHIITTLHLTFVSFLSEGGPATVQAWAVDISEIELEGTRGSFQLLQ